MINLYDLERPHLISLLAEARFSAFHAQRVWEALYRKQVTRLDDVDVRPDVLEWLKQNTILPQPYIKTAIDSSDGQTRKFLLDPLPPPDNQAIETVIMQYSGRYTACVSTQAGCAMGCVFCATGQMGFLRHLSAGEIVVQLLTVARDLAKRGERLRNIVLMGMGEPLHNYDNVMTALDIITDDKGLAIAPSKITLSTVGLPAGIRRMADEGRNVNLAVSLHGATDEARQALLPLAHKYTLDKLLSACRYYVEKRGRRIFFEWTLIAGENDQPEQAHALGDLLKDIVATVNVIPLNPTNGYNGNPSAQPAIDQFRAILWDYGIRTTVRQRRGIDVAAGCGQLRVLHKYN